MFNVLREHIEIKEEARNLETSLENTVWKAMTTYCVICKKNTANENSSVTKTKHNRLMLLSSCAVCGKTKSSFIKNKELSTDLV